MWLQDVIARLKAQVTGMREIDGASSLDAAMRGAVSCPSAYAIPLTETGRELAHTGPVFTGMQVQGDRATLSFDTGGRALAVRGDDRLHGFELAGVDGLFHPAQATIDGDRVVVRSAAVPVPVAVRYAWQDAPVEANLVNDAGLPASPFRSDNW